MELTIQDAIMAIVSLIGAGVFGWFWYTLKNLNKKASESVSREEVEKMINGALTPIKKDVEGIKGDTRSLADSSLQAANSLEKRMDGLMLHLMNRTNK
ncbi:hypothetical protein [Haliea sp.]|uniref:hypothetical protein n=1 Tax=Haliea sp. TaxID=1932666 RepID=UPI0025C1F1D7|nr:hypothetical protein [Haliea sp.]|tara:strand:+ start:395 stop:688 length:294 start_codon:yes stop_codon:yes gene_type:complete